MADYAYIDHYGDIMFILTDPTVVQLDLSSPFNVTKGVRTIQIAPVGFTNPVWSFATNQYIERPVPPPPPLKTGSGIQDFAEFYDAAGSLNVTTSFTDLPLNGVIRNPANLLTPTVGNTIFEINRPGIYLIDYVVSISILSNSGSSSIARLMVKLPAQPQFAEMLGTRTHGYHRGTADGLDSVTCPMKLMDAPQGTQFKIQVMTTTVVGTTVQNSSRFSLVRL